MKKDHNKLPNSNPLSKELTNILM